LLNTEYFKSQKLLDKNHAVCDVNITGRRFITGRNVSTETMSYFIKKTLPCAGSSIHFAAILHTNPNQELTYVKKITGFLNIMQNEVVR